MSEEDSGRCLLVLRVSGQLCAIPAADVRESVHVAATVQVPGQPSLLHGFLNLRGEAVPVLLLDRLLDLAPPRRTLYDVIVLLAAPKGTIGLLVSTVEGVAAGAPLRSIDSLHSFNGCATGQFDWESNTVTLLSSQHLLLEKERQCIHDLAAQVQSRLAEAFATGL